MKETIEKLWNEYFSEECATIDTAEEKELIKKGAKIHKKVLESLSNEQRGELEKYVEILYEIQAFYSQKAFFKGCEFATSFFLEIGKRKQS